MGRIILRRLAWLGAALALAACASSAPAATMAPTAPAPTTASQPAAGPLAPCDELQPHIAAALGVDVAVAEEPLVDYIGGATVAGCQLRATGTGTQFASPAAVADQLRAMLGPMGWAEDDRYLADGPTSTGTGLRNGPSLAVLLVDWAPGPAVSCPADQPIGACNVPPDQQIYTITITVGQPD